jgi:pimeloyl-ACP methyl ester carboxylesterase
MRTRRFAAPELRRRPAALLGVVIVLASVSGVAAAAVTAQASAAASRATGSGAIKVGTQTLKECKAGSTSSYCGYFPVPLDYTDPDGPTIKIAYVWYPATSPGPTDGTVVPVEGGPGYPSALSVKGGYQVMYGPLLAHWNMLAIDLRGTGRSANLDCPALQDFSGEASGPRFDAVVATCANALNHRWKYPNGAYVHASDLFTSALAANDMAAIIEALDLKKIDLYGDSYGSFFAQSFASRYPGLIRSVVLDSTYPTQDLGPWYDSTIKNMPADFDNACSRSPACAQASSIPAWGIIESLTTRLRKSPISGEVPGANGVVGPVTMDVVGLVNLVNDAAGDPYIYRDMDAAARALLDSNDPDPLLRLYAERTAFQEDYFDTPSTVYSAELYLAVSCLDYPQLFDMHANEATRTAQLARRVAALPSSTFAPFTTGEWLAQDQNTEAYTVCVAWPSPILAVPPTVGQPLLPKSIPVLILGGEFDTWTPPSGVPKVMKQLGGHSRFIELANSTHVVGEDDTVCGDHLVQEFVKAPQSLDTMNASCAPLVPTIHSVGIYAQSLSAVPPLKPGRSNTGSLALLRLGAAAVATAGDALARFGDILGTLDHGLHGGTSLAIDNGAEFKLTGDALVPGVAVSGTFQVTTTTVSASLTTYAAGEPSATFHAAWAAAAPATALAEVTGMSDGHVISGSIYAP